jgi:hypothetical protein
VVENKTLNLELYGWWIGYNSIESLNNMDFTGAYKHYSEQLIKRFNLEISYENYLEKYVFNRTLNEKYVGKYVRYQFGDMVNVYYITTKYEYPITVYKLDKFNKGRILRTFN